MELGSEFNLDPKDLTIKSGNAEESTDDKNWVNAVAPRSASA